VIRTCWAFLPLVLATLVLAACDEARSDDDDILEPRKERPLVFESPQTCAECHQSHVDEWAISNHAYALVDPVFVAMLDLGQAATEGKLGQFCVQCHTPVGLAAGQTPVVIDEATGKYGQPLDGLDEVAKHGVSCDVCHSMTDVVEPVNARSVLTPDGTRRGTIKDPVPNDAHASAFSDLHETSDMCGSCHAVINSKQARVEETFPEWAASSFARDGKTCQSCHMPEYVGQAAKDGPQRKVHRHQFVGVDVSLVAPEDFPGYDEMRDLTTALLKSSATLTAEQAKGQPGLAVSIENLAGHALPSGATAERQMWLHVVVTDETGNVAFESGALDDNGDLKVGLETLTIEPGADPQLVVFGQLMIDVPGLAALEGAEREATIADAEAACRPMGLGGVDPASGITPVSFPWQASWQCNHLIAADGRADVIFDLAALPPSAYQASIELLFRTFPPYFLRELEDKARLDPAVKERVPVVTMATAQVSLALPGDG